MVEEFIAITGLDAEQAGFFLEMAGFDMETALQLFFSASDGSSAAGGDLYSGPSDATSGGSGGAWTNDNLRDIVFPAGGAVHEAWLVQGLAPRGRSGGFIPSTNWDQLGIDQPQNGPCGVVAAYMGSVIVTLMRAGKLAPGVRADDGDLVTALVNILTRCKESSGSFQICTWAPNEPIGGAVAVTSASNDGELLGLLGGCLDQYLSPGGAILLVYSAVATYGAAKFQGQNDIVPLVSNYGTLSFQLCTSALMNLLLSGEPRESLGAYDGLTGLKIDWAGPTPLMGLLSGSEKELKMRVHDAYKFPEHEVYVLHGQDHFTLSFQVPNSRHDSATSGDSGAIGFSLVHWNGLPPAGPLCTTVSVIAREPSARAPPTAAEGIGKEYKPVVGSIDSIIQAEKKDKDKYPKDWKQWRYEVALAIDDPTDASEERPADLPMPAVFTLNSADLSDGKPWRCRSCYQTRYSTMCFGLNEAGTTLCQHCGQARQVCGWTMWMGYEDLPRQWRGSVDRQYGPLFITVLRTKWPNCDVSFEGDPPVIPSV